MPVPESVDAGPTVALSHLDELWFQVGGTLCNLTCQHCFISCSPHNQNFGFLSLARVREVLSEAQALGVKEYYFTGGEPFLNRELTDILCATLQVGPVSVLTNGTILRDEWLSQLAQAERASRYSLEIRISLDGFSAETNDPVRGCGTFERTIRGVMQFVEAGFLPILTAARVWPEEREAEVVASFVSMLRARGYARPRLKILPTLLLGAEVERTRGYQADERITHAMMQEFDASRLLCEHSRLVSDRGVHVCPILLEAPDGLLGEDLRSSLGSFALRHGACFTCYQHGSICANPATAPNLNQHH